MKNTHHDIPPALAQALRSARRVVVFTGAGVSAESGIATFRDALTGLWSRFDAQALATPEAFREHPDLVWGWYEWRRAQVLSAAPNAAHHAIAALARHVPELTVITQNVDDLHERAGSRAVTHLHGSLHAPRCSRCGAPQAFATDLPQEPDAGRRLAPPACTECGAPVRPGVVWFGESLPAQAWRDATLAVQQCDLLFSIGTSSLVYPAAELPRLAVAGGATVVQVNPAATPLDAIAHHNLRGAAAQIMPAVLAAAQFTPVLPAAPATPGGREVL
ncbi:SIR2 family NAD-dependent protein deacylase [Achromobacter mucicolens]|uniref:SIR2 family NAD-dependent protein deacylase n=1 Tax=Achromobacter mucicolens TaxID=1389922 RepID=UPI00244A9E45|nr:NAD-dependent protein deacylase [Achromobacter mucicolens]MDH1524812.1 NAD-dependent protein deacylase [Achromobacter mucicolens]